MLTGAGGSGKTRLALEAARETATSFANGAAFVDLAPLRDSALVVGAIARALGIPDVSGEDSLQTLADALGPRELLLFVDNAEHVRAAAPSFVELLAQAPHLTLLVTSRVVLHLSGEQVYPVEPLAVRAAVALFLERAREAEPRFRPIPRTSKRSADLRASGRDCRSQSSWPRAACAPSLPSSCSTGSTRACRFSPAARAICPHASKRCERPWSGATTCSPTPKAATSATSPCSPAAPWRQPRPSAAPRSSGSPRSSTPTSCSTPLLERVALLHARDDS